MTPTRRPARASLTALAALGLSVVALSGVSACSADAPTSDSDRIVLTPQSDGAEHTHAPGQGHAEGGPQGDGTRSKVAGRRITAVHLPAPGAPGEMSFQILDRDREPLTSYVEEQTKLLHLYVVRDDLGSFRHLHPVQDEDGTWRTRVDLDTAGTWRVVAEFQAEGDQRPTVLGAHVDVPGRSTYDTAQPIGESTGDDGVVRARVLEPGSVGPDGRLQIEITTVAGEPVTLGSYLGAAAHVTGFRIGADGFVHVHPYGAPEVTPDGTVLTFHTTFSEAGAYRLFVQIRVDGLLHQLPVTADVTD